ncbi:MAG: PQQ-binding-like beta-propeller repeat protein [Gemmataceae bacterium]|nr:PQQ-binding-like beta-propeller repeat protein [Gemmataceae bacterium]
MRWLTATLLFSNAVLAASAAEPPSWPQFRGINGAAVAAGDHRYPAEIGPDQNVLWKIAVPSGHSSPVVWGDRLFLTAVRDQKLLTMAFDRATGKALWEVEAPCQKLEKVHQIGSHAQPTPATDGERVVSFFGSCGLLCYDTAGKLIWHHPLGPFKNDLGAGSSPVLAGDLVLLNQDHDIDSFLLAVDKRTGKTVWKVDRSEFPVGYATPVLWSANGRGQVVIAGSLRVVGYDLASGKEAWTVRGMARAVHMTPTVGSDGTLYVAGWTSGGDANDRFEVPSFDDMLAKHDANKNGTLELDELPDGPLKMRFSMLDRNKDGHVTREEYEFMRRVFDKATNRVLAIKPGGQGDVTETHVLWEQRKYLPVVPSPLLYEKHLFLVKAGGLLATLDARTGQMVKQERVPGGGDYYSSPVGGDGKVYLLSQRGHLAVVSAAGDWKVLHRSRFEADVYATPALVEGRIYLRTAGHLYCFGLKP